MSLSPGVYLELNFVNFEYCSPPPPLPQCWVVTLICVFVPCSELTVVVVDWMGDRWRLL